MNGEIMGYTTEPQPKELSVRPASLTEQMQFRKQRLEQELEEVNKVLDGLAKNPEAAALFDSISRLGGLRGY